MQARIKGAGHGNRRLGQPAGSPVTGYLHPTTKLKTCFEGYLFAAITDPVCPESQLTAVPPSVESLRASRVTIVPFLLSAEARNMDRSRYRRWVISRRPTRTGAGAGCGPGNQPT